MSIKEFHGKVSKCRLCTNSEEAPVECDHCKCRGYVAECMNCSGAGMVTVPMAGGPGNMSSTCHACGGTGSFGVNKPENWVEPEPQKLPVKEDVAEPITA